MNKRTVILSVWLGLAASIASSAWAKYTTCLLLCFGPTGIVGGWPLPFINYEIATTEQFALPRNMFNIVMQDLPYSVEEFHLWHFLLNTALWIIFVFLVLKLLAYLRSSTKKLSD
jgi:hypothetical protein